MPSAEPTPHAPGARRRGSNEPDPVALKIKERLAALRDSEVNPEDAVEQGLLAILESTDIAAGAICLFDPRQQVLRLAAERGLSDQGCKSLRHIRRGYAGSWDMPLQSLGNRRVYLIENAAQNRYVPPLIEEPDKMRTVLCVPLMTGSTPVGSLILISTARKPLADHEVVRLELPGRDLAVIIEAARTRARQAERTSAAAAPAQPYRGGAFQSGENIINQRFDPATEVERSRQLAAAWERKHQELAGELAAATAREQRLRDELTSAAERLQNLSAGSRGKGTKDEAAQLAQNARLQASLAEAEAIAARERMRAAEVERKLTDLAELLSASTAREDELRKLLESGSGEDPARRNEYIDQSLELARLNARLAEAETALAASRARSDEGADAAETARMRARIDELDTALQEARQATQAGEAERQTIAGELAGARAREQALQDELRAAGEQHQRLLAEADERERQREQARAGEITRLHDELRDAQESAQRAADRIADLESRHQEIAGQLAGTSAREQALREELQSTGLTHQARVLELEALLEHERSVVLDWQRKYEALTTVDVGAEASRAAEWEERCASLSTQLEEALGRNGAIDRELQDVRAQLAERSIDAASAAAEKAVETETLAARLAEAEAARAAAEQSATSWAERHDKLAAELEASVARAEELTRALETVRTETVTDRVEAEGARAAAQADAEATRAALTDAQQRAETLSRELEELRTSTALLERVKLPPPAPAGAAPAVAPPRPPSAAPVSARSMKGEVHRIAVLDDPAAWKDTKLHGVEIAILGTTDDVPARLAAQPADRLLVNLAAKGAFEAALALRAAGVAIPCCGCLIAPGSTRGLPLGFVEVARTPLDPDDVVGVLAPFAGRGTRVLTAGADADAFISLRQALSRQGMSVSMAWDGKQASDLLQMVRPEIVVIDLDIPPRSGLSLLIELVAAGQSMPMLVLLPGRLDLGKRTGMELADPAIVDRLLPRDRLLEDVRRSGKPK